MIWRCAPARHLQSSASARGLRVAVAPRTGLRSLPTLRRAVELPRAAQRHQRVQDHRQALAPAPARGEARFQIGQRHRPRLRGQHFGDGLDLLWQAAGPGALCWRGGGQRGARLRLVVGAGVDGRLRAARARAAGTRAAASAPCRRLLRRRAWRSAPPAVRAASPPPRRAPRPPPACGRPARRSGRPSHRPAAPRRRVRRAACAAR